MADGDLSKFFSGGTDKIIPGKKVVFAGGEKVGDLYRSLWTAVKRLYF